MRKNNILLVLIITFVTIFSATSCTKKNVTVAEAIRKIGVGLEEPYDRSIKYDLDERFSHFQLFYIGGEGWVHLKGEEGLLSMIFDTIENEDGSVKCTVKSVYVKNYGNIAHGWIEGERVKEVIGDDIVFTLVLENNVVTTHDLPSLLVIE